MVGGAILLRSPGSPLGHFLTFLFLIDVLMILSIIPHELGHALVGRLLGWRVFTVAFGIGKTAFKFRYRGTVFLFNYLPVAGLTQVAPIESRGLRVKWFFIMLAGPAANLTIAGIVFLIWRNTSPDTNFMGLPWLARWGIFVNLWLAAANLLPRHSRLLNTATDGKQMLTVFSKKQKVIDDLLAFRFVLEAVICLEEQNGRAKAIAWCQQGLAQFPQNSHLLNLSGVFHLESEKGYGRAREIFCQILSQETKRNITHYLLLNNIAWADILIGDPNLLPEADQYSLEAYSAAAWVPSFAGTRGTVLVELGQIEAGIPLLKAAYEKHHVLRNKAENASYLAIAYARLGNQVEAQKYLQLAVQSDVSCLRIEKARAELKKSGIDLTAD